VDAYLGDVVAYNIAVRTHEACLSGVKHSNDDQHLFEAITMMFQKIADLPSSLFPNVPEWVSYQTELSNSIDKLLKDDVAAGVIPRTEADCQPVPIEKPEFPKR
jgi:hypothetical protein